MNKAETYFIIVNPFAGTHRINWVTEKVVPWMKQRSVKFEYHLTAYAGHAVELARSAVEKGYDVVVVVGGDGTVNEVVNGLVGSKVILAIIPAGSGNGLALELGMSLRFLKAISQILNGKNVVLDMGLAGDKLFTCTCGLGFDAHIAWVMNQSEHRGGWQYLRLVLKESLIYKPVEVTWEMDGLVRTEKVLMLTIANARQFGNHALIAPLAQIDDGQLDVVMWKPFSKWLYPLVGLALLLGVSHWFPFVEIYRGSKIVIHHSSGQLYHVDGEPFQFAGFPMLVQSIRGGIRARIPSGVRIPKNLFPF